MRLTTTGVGRVLLAVIALALALPVMAEVVLPLSELRVPGRVLLLRHAVAPGVGDPPHFKVGDCATQRNLDAEGRAQARRLGEQLRAAGIVQARVLSSQWCRCLDTARLLGLGPVDPLPALNSFFGRPEARAPTLAALRTFLAGLPMTGDPVILVTHQVVVDAFQPGTTPSGGGSLLQLDGTPSPRWLGRIAVD
jgi:Histidine phosphatase superfamily (branch 1)